MKSNRGTNARPLNRATVAIEPCLLRLRFSHSDARNGRRRERDARQHAIGNRSTGSIEGVVDDDRPMDASDVHELRMTGDVARSPDLVVRRPQVGIGANLSVGASLDADSIEIQMYPVGGRWQSGAGRLNLARPAIMVQNHRHAAAVLSHRRDRGASANGYVFIPQYTCQDLRNLRLVVRTNAFESLEDSHARSEPREQLPELQADVVAARDNQRLRQLFKLHRARPVRHFFGLHAGRMGRSYDRRLVVQRPLAHSTQRDGSIEPERICTRIGARDPCTARSTDRVR